jgi:flagellar basal-body rod modification protein FlgD
MSTTVPAVGGTNTSVPSVSNSSLGKDDFLKLLVSQLKNQDPMNPMQGTEFASQLAQFSSVEQLQNLNATLTQSVQANQIMTQSIGNSLAATLIGKDVKATGSTFTTTGTGPVHLGYTLPAGIDKAVVRIYDASGGLVRTLQGTGTASGDNTFTWDGANDQGTQVPGGKYTFKVEALDAKGAPVTASPFMEGTIGGVRFKSDGAYFVIDGTEVALADVLEILKN